MNIIIRVLLIATLIVCLKDTWIKPKLYLIGQIVSEKNYTLFRFRCYANHSPLKYHAEFRIDSLTLYTLRLQNQKCYNSYDECTETQCQCTKDTFTWTKNRSDDVNFPKNNSEVTCVMKFETPNGYIIGATTGVIFNGSAFVPSPMGTQYDGFDIDGQNDAEVKIAHHGEIDVKLTEDKNNNHEESALSFLEKVIIITVAVIVVVITISVAIYCLMKKRGIHIEEGHVRYNRQSPDKKHTEIDFGEGLEEKCVCKECGVRTNYAICYEHKIFLCQIHLKTHYNICNTKNKIVKVGNSETNTICSTCKSIAEIVCTNCWNPFCESCTLCNCSNGQENSKIYVRINNQTVTIYTNPSKIENIMSGNTESC